MNVQVQNNAEAPQFGGGPATWLHYAGPAFLDRGHAVSVLCRRSAPGLPDAERLPWGGMVYRHDAPSVEGRRWVLGPTLLGRNLQRVVRRYVDGTDVVVARNLFYAYASATAIPQTPLIYIVPGLFRRVIEIRYEGPQVRTRLRRLLIGAQTRRIERVALQRATHLVVLSEIRKRETVDLYGLPADRITVIPPGIPLAAPARRDPDLRRHLGLPDDARVVLTACRLVRQKNLTLLLRAFAHVRTPNTFLVIAGEGTLRGALEQEIRALHLEPRVRLLGFRRDVDRLMAAADVFVLPSVYEPFGLVLLEAMGQGLPCIGLRADYPTVVVANEEIIEHGRTGFCVAPTADAMADAIDRIVSDDALRREMGEAARTSAWGGRYSWSRHVDAILSLARER